MTKAVGKLYFLKGFASAEGTVTDGNKSFGKRYLFKSLTLYKCMRGNDADACRNRDLRKRGTLKECINAYKLKTFGKRYLRKRITVCESIIFNDFKSVR